MSHCLPCHAHSHLRWPERVVKGKLDVQEEDTAGVWRTCELKNIIAGSRVCAGHFVRAQNLNFRL